MRKANINGHNSWLGDTHIHQHQQELLHSPYSRLSLHLPRKCISLGNFERLTSPGFPQNVCSPRVPLFGRMFLNRFSRFIRECHLIVIEVKRTYNISTLTSVALDRSNS